MSADFQVRKALPEDSLEIYNLICELAEFEKAPHEVVNTPELIKQHAEGDTPLFQAWVTTVDNEVCGLALCYVRYSTWKGPVLYLEDLIIKDTFRGQGMGKALFEVCLAYAQEKNYSRMCWQVLDWNEGAIDFYSKYGATVDAGWVNCALEIPG